MQSLGSVATTHSVFWRVKHYGLFWDLFSLEVREAGLEIKCHHFKTLEWLLNCGWLKWIIKSAPCVLEQGTWSVNQMLCGVICLSDNDRETRERRRRRTRGQSLLAAAAQRGQCPTAVSWYHQQEAQRKEDGTYMVMTLCNIQRITDLHTCTLLKVHTWTNVCTHTHTQHLYSEWLHSGSNSHLNYMQRLTLSAGKCYCSTGGVYMRETLHFIIF